MTTIRNVFETDFPKPSVLEKSEPKKTDHENLEKVFSIREKQAQAAEAERKAERERLHAEYAAILTGATQPTTEKI
jgi:hypothetical protein